MASLGTLTHPNVMKILGLFTLKSEKYFAFEFSGSGRLIDRLSDTSSLSER
jgi:hypothetical protein